MTYKLIVWYVTKNQRLMPQGYLLGKDDTLYTGETVKDFVKAIQNNHPEISAGCVLEIDLVTRTGQTSSIVL